MITLFDVAIIICIFIVLKSLIIGSDFSLIDYINDGKKYTSWYFDRETYKEYKSMDIKVRQK